MSEKKFHRYKSHWARSYNKGDHCSIFRTINEYIIKCTIWNGYNLDAEKKTNFSFALSVIDRLLILFSFFHFSLGWKIFSFLLFFAWTLLFTLAKTVSVFSVFWGGGFSPFYVWFFIVQIICTVLEL